MTTVSPQRIQLKRTPGWRKPAGAVSVARPSPWGNPYRVGCSYVWAEDEPCPFPGSEPGVVLRPGDQIERCVSIQRAVIWYEAWITKMVPSVSEDARDLLAGRDLACWCPLDQPCHGDVLLRIANQGARGDS